MIISRIVVTIEKNTNHELLIDILLKFLKLVRNDWPVADLENPFDDLLP